MGGLSLPLAIRCPCGTEHEVEEYGQDGSAVYYKGQCKAEGAYFEVHVWNRKEVDRSWLKGCPQ